MLGSGLVVAPERAAAEERDGPGRPARTRGTLVRVIPAVKELAPRHAGLVLLVVVEPGAAVLVLDVDLLIDVGVAELLGVGVADLSHHSLGALTRHSQRMEAVAPGELTLPPSLSVADTPGWAHSRLDGPTLHLLSCWSGCTVAEKSPAL